MNLEPAQKEPAQKEKVQRRGRGLPAAGAILLIRFWQRCVSPLLGTHCRFYPTCSEYAAQAFAAHGFLRGLRLTTGRVLRCSSLSSGGIDPVPGVPTPETETSKERDLIAGMSRKS